MAITGGIKFFDGIKNLKKDGASIVASSGTARADFVIGRNPLLLWKSDTADDDDTETLTLTLPQDTSINRLFLINHNFKDFEVEWQLNAGGWDSFDNVVGINGVLPNNGAGDAILEDEFAYSSAYYEFDAVTVDQIRVTINSTQVVDAKKFLGQLIVTSELGTFSGYPTVKPGVDRNKRVSQMLSGRASLTRGLEIFSSSIRFANYPTAEDFREDVSLAYELNNRDDAFLVYLCGGRTGQTYFRHTIPGFRLQDAFLVNVINDPDSVYQKNVYINGVDFELKLEEAA